MCFRVRGYTVLKKNQMIQKDFVMSVPRDGFVFFQPEIYASLYTKSHCGRKTSHCSIYSVGHRDTSKDEKITFAARLRIVTSNLR